jgi:hypothetical protein
MTGFMQQNSFDREWHKQAREIVLISLWLTLFLVLLTGWWWIQGDSLMRGFCLGFALLFAVLGLSIALSDYFFDSRLLEQARRQLSFRSIGHFVAYMVLFASLVGIATILSAVARR